jgi:hypothetical protein
MIDLVTVVYRLEISLLELQAKSIDTYFEDNFINSITVIVNDNDSVCDLIDKSWWGKYKHIVTIVPYSVYGYTCRINGWENQQLCKLLAASQSQQTWAMILDAKTLFVKPCTPELMFTGDKCNSRLINIFPQFVEAQQSLEKMFDISFTKAIGPGGVPFVMHTDTVRSMIAYIESNFETTFDDFFQTKCRYPDLITEFYLYSAYVQYRYGNSTLLYSNTQDWDCVNLADWQVDEFDRIYHEMSLPTTLTVSVHAQAWNLLSQQQKFLYLELLESKKIINDPKHTLDKLNTVVIN